MITSDIAISTRRIPSLVQYCQRVAVQHLHSISGFGDDLRYELIQPILEHCTPETLQRLEEASPHLCSCTRGLWKEMCYRYHPLHMEQYTGDYDEPESWRQVFFDVQTKEAKRLEDLGTRLRAQRQLADNEKKKREVKLTTALPPSKRRRTGYAPNPPAKTLFQKARMEASKIQKTIYTGVTVPRSSNIKDYRSTNTESQHTTFPNRVIVNTVYRRDSSSTSSSAESHSSSLAPTKPYNKLLVVPKQPTPLPRPPPPSTGKKDPMAALFMPKHRAHSQLPGGFSGIVSK